ncbi:MAG: nuclear transport factor 2 family protein [Candidatus Kariarchaeaceae archaeon]|jgi:hypothetical protein
MQNKYKKVALQLIEDLNTKNFQNLQNHFAANASFTVFIIDKGEYTLVKGRDDVVDVLIQNFDIGDAQCELQTILSDGNKVAISGLVAGSNYFDIDNFPFQIKIMAIVDFDDNGKIHHVNYSTNTFEMMRLSGKAILSIGNKEKIRQYILTLQNIGILPATMLSE